MVLFAINVLEGIIIMSCCGRNRSQVVRSQQITKNNAPKKVLVQHVVRSKNATKQLGDSVKLPVIRQRVSSSNKCPKCGYPVMIVNNNKAMVRRCSSASCNYIIPK